eukprot:scaffold238811_cov31-Tisochrysis_lutea.AAC.2
MKLVETWSSRSSPQGRRLLSIGLASAHFEVSSRCTPPSSAQVAPLAPKQRAAFDAAASFWSDRLLPELERASEMTGAPAGQVTRAFWGAHQRASLLHQGPRSCMLLICGVILHTRQSFVCCNDGKVPVLVEQVEAALASGKCAVIGLQSTGALRNHHTGRSPLVLSGLADASLRKQLNRARENLAAATMARMEARTTVMRPHATSAQRAEAAVIVERETTRVGFLAQDVARLEVEVAQDEQMAGQVRAAQNMG